MTSILGTQSIQHPNGTAAATVDASGRILKSVQVFWVLGFANNNQREGTMIFDLQHKMVNYSQEMYLR